MVSVPLPFNVDLKWHVPSLGASPAAAGSTANGVAAAANAQMAIASALMFIAFSPLLHFICAAMKASMRPSESFVAVVSNSMWRPMKSNGWSKRMAKPWVAPG